MIIENNQVLSFDLKNAIFQSDATIIETQTIIQMDNYIMTSFYHRYLNGSNEIPFQYDDLIRKLSDISGSPVPIIRYPEILAAITDIVGGEVVYADDSKSFYFVRNNKALYSPNIATGIKSFGILQMLLRAGHIHEYTYLILDEPEVHLHPKWEIEYAKLVVLLSKAGVPIIISTHSPYFLQALVKFIKDYETIDISKFYFGEKNKGNTYSKFNDVTDNLEPIFKALAEPMQDIYSN